MFNIGRDEPSFRSMKADRHKFANHRMDGFRHNPYVGSFHAVPYFEQRRSLLMAEAKRNPMIGLFRHSPAGNLSRLGLKSVIYEDQQESVPIVSQLRANRESKATVPTKSIIASLKEIPMTIFSASSAVSLADKSESAHEGSKQQQPVDDGPMCSICLEKYTDGDEIVTLACSHCFHNECANKWFYQSCLRENADSEVLRCPQCRQDHVALSEQGSCHDEGIPNKSFYLVGESLLRDGGYDFLSDAGSERNGSSGSHAPLTSPPRSSPKLPPRRRASPAVHVQPRSTEEVSNSGVVQSGGSCEEVPPSPQRSAHLEWSAYSDCGVPLRPVNDRK